jgi:hypothetical protein
LTAATLLERNELSDNYSDESRKKYKDNCREAARCLRTMPTSYVYKCAIAPRAFTFYMALEFSTLLGDFSDHLQQGLINAVDNKNAAVKCFFGSSVKPPLFLRDNLPDCDTDESDAESDDSRMTNGSPLLKDGAAQRRMSKRRKTQTSTGSVGSADGDKEVKETRSLEVTAQDLCNTILGGAKAGGKRNADEMQ